MIIKSEWAYEAAPESIGPQSLRVLPKEWRVVADRDCLILHMRGDTSEVTWLGSGETVTHFYLCNFHFFL